MFNFRKKARDAITVVRKKIRKLRRLLWYCRFIILVAGAMSIWANVLHARVGWIPMVIAAGPPVIVLGGWEMVSRIPLRPHSNRLIRFVRPVSTGLLAFGAAWLSYWHQRAAIMRYTEDPQAGYILPALVDGLMIIASVSVMELNAQVSDLEAFEQGQQVRLPSYGQPVKTRRSVSTPMGSTKKEKVASLMAANPKWTVQQIADGAGASYGYTYQLVQELSRGNGAELVSQ